MPDKSKNKYIAIKVSPEFHRWAMDFARWSQTSVSDLIGTALYDLASRRSFISPPARIESPVARNR
jgi:hypothetical protein